jgi:hypothetical protein
MGPALPLSPRRAFMRNIEWAAVIDLVARRGRLRDRPMGLGDRSI